MQILSDILVNLKGKKERKVKVIVVSQAPGGKKKKHPKGWILLTGCQWKAVYLDSGVRIQKTTVDVLKSTSSQSTEKIRKI